MKKKEIEHRLVCRSCGTTDVSVLHKNSSWENKKKIIQTYSCRSCTSKRKREYYHRLTAEQKTHFMIHSNRWNNRQKQINREGV